MQSTDIAIYALIAVVLIAAILIFVAMRQRRTHALRDRFGEEYDRVLHERGKRGPAEAALEEREKRVSQLDIRPLSAPERSAFMSEWREVKSVFVDSPPEAVLHADRMLAKMMAARGYPMADFDHRYEDLTVDHREVAQHYRAGHDIAERQGRGEASTEDLRQAMKHYEALFDDLVRDEMDKENRTATRRTERA